MYLNLFLTSFVLILFTNLCARGHQSHNYQDVVSNHQPHDHIHAPPQQQHPPQQGGYGAPVGQGGQGDRPPKPVTTTPPAAALWEKYGKIDFMHDLNHLREEANNLLYMQEADQITNEVSAFYYTKLHDFNSDGKLDGLELLLAVKHSLVHHNASYEFTPLEDMSNYVDSELNLMDLNNDGFVDYGEIYTYMEANKQQQHLPNNAPNNQQINPPNNPPQSQ